MTHLQYIDGERQGLQKPEKLGSRLECERSRLQARLASTLRSRETVNSVVFPTRGFVTADLGRSDARGDGLALGSSPCPQGGWAV